jgi:hypothetical protein
MTLPSFSSKKLSTIIVLAVIIIGAIIITAEFFAHTPDPVTKQPTFFIVSDTEQVLIEEPFTEDIIGPTVAFSGSASGTWFFEGDFPVTLFDDNNIVLGQSFATAEGEWMTTEPVAFSGGLALTQAPTSSTGRLVFSKDNPSDLPEHDASVSLPVAFAESYEQKTVWFPASFPQNPEVCTELVSFNRFIPSDQDLPEAVIDALIRGPQGPESFSASQGLPKDAVLASSTLSDGVLTLDFSALPVAGSCLVEAVRAQVTQTMLQFDTVESVFITVNGSADEALQP